MSYQICTICTNITEDSTTILGVYLPNRFSPKQLGRARGHAHAANFVAFEITRCGLSKDASPGLSTVFEKSEAAYGLPP